MSKLLKLLFDVALFFAAIVGLFYGNEGALRVVLFVVYAIFLPTIFLICVFYDVLQSSIRPHHAVASVRLALRCCVCTMLVYHGWYASAFIVLLFVVLLYLVQTE
jgi:hypothetical protein